MTGTTPAAHPMPTVRPTPFDPPDHTRYRRLLTGKFTVRRMRRLTERVERITAEHLDAMERLTPPVDEDMAIYGVHRLPVTWEGEGT